MSPDVSVIIPTYNRRRFLEQAIQSCFDGNDVLDVEVVVVDDGSTDGTRDWLRRLNDERVRPFFQEHQGAQVARNRGMKEARGYAIKFLDDDDYLMPGALAKQYRVLNSNGVDVCYGNYQVYSEEENEVASCVRNDDYSRLFEGIASAGIKRTPIIFLFRRSAIEQVRWNESLDYHQDVAFMLDAASRHLTCRKTDALVAVLRTHGQGKIADTRKQVSVPKKRKLKSKMFWRAYRQLSAHGPLDASLRQTAAAGLWRQAHMLAPYSFRAFKKWYDKIRVVDPTFLPPRPNALLSMIDRVASPRLTEWLINPIRKAKL
jgi:glycosyltransferase involved in cell wall biosynthesis